MTRDDARAIVARRLGNRGTSLDTEIVAELQQAQLELELLPELPWFLSYRDVSLTTTANQAYVTLPATFIMVDEDKGVRITDSSGNRQPLIKTKHAQALNREWFNDNQDAALPEVYDIQNLLMYVYPTPDAAYTLEVSYFKQDDALSAVSTENNWLKYAPDLLIAYAGGKVALFNGFPEQYPVWDAEYKRALARMWAQSVARTEADNSAYLGG